MDSPTMRGVLGPSGRRFTISGTEVRITQRSIIFWLCLLAGGVATTVVAASELRTAARDSLVPMIFAAATAAILVAATMIGFRRIAPRLLVVTADNFIVDRHRFGTQVSSVLITGRSRTWNPGRGVSRSTVEWTLQLGLRSGLQHSYLLARGAALGSSLDSILGAIKAIYPHAIMISRLA